MANYCSGLIVVEGPKEELDKFKKLASSYKKKGSKFPDKVLDMNKFIPYPEKYAKLDKLARDWEEKANAYAKSLGRRWYNSAKKGAKNLTKKQREDFIKEHGEQPKDGYNKGGYEWCIKERGTKWNFMDPELQTETDEKLVYYFITAWSPAIPVVHKMGQMFKELTFTYDFDEPGIGFKGVFVMKDGFVAENITEKYIQCPECMEALEEIKSDKKKYKEKFKCENCGVFWYVDKKGKWYDEKGKEV